MAAETSLPELQESNKQFKIQADILEATNDAVVALDQNLCIRYCNAAAERMYAVRLSDVVGKPLLAMHGYAWLAPEDESRCLADLVERGSWQGDYIHILRDGAKIVVNATVNVLPPQSGGGMVAIIRDVSGQKRVASKIQKDTVQLARANEDLLHFAYAASHDLQTPIRTIRSFSQLLALRYKAQLDGQGGEFIRWIVEASARMDTMLQDLLQFAKVAGGEAHLSEDVPLEDTLASALESLRSQIQETQAVITHDSFPVVAGEAGQFTRLFQNLIGNSLKYRRPAIPPEIHISAKRNDADWVITVRDNGIGFEPEYAERIFGVFQRLHGGEFAGTGIGLTICKRIVERRGGRIWADGKPGEGAAFSFSIPDSTETIHAAPPMDWARVQTVFEKHPEPSIASGHFDELFKTLDLAQAVVRKLDGTILIWTKGAERLFGWPESETIGKGLQELIQTESSQPLTEIETVLLRSGEWTGELKARKRDGTAVWLASHKILYHDGSGRPQSVIEVHNDITALKNAEAALRRSSEQRDLALRAAQMGIWRWDRQTGTVEWSQTLESLLGMEPGSFEGTFDAGYQRMHPDDRQPFQERVAEAFKTGADYKFENRLRRNDGSYCRVRGRGRVVFDERNQPAGLVGVIWDISERSQREADRPLVLDRNAISGPAE